MVVVHGPRIGARIPRSAAGTGSALAWMTVLSMTVVSAFSGTACGGDARGSTARGAGASLSAPLVSRWADAYPGPGRVDYRAVGSGGAVHMLEIGTVDFGVRDAGEGEGSRDDANANANTNANGELVDPACQSAPFSTTARGDGKSRIVFHSIFAGDTATLDSEPRRTRGCFDVYLAEPREVNATTLAPPRCRGHLRGTFDFLYRRSKPSQPFP